MATPIYEMLHITSDVSIIVISVALMLISGFAMTRITKQLRLPNVTAYIVAGILLGPYCFNMIQSGVVNGMSFIADIALAFIAFDMLPPSRTLNNETCLGVLSCLGKVK